MTDDEDVLKSVSTERTKVAKGREIYSTSFPPSLVSYYQSPYCSPSPGINPSSDISLY